MILALAFVAAQATQLDSVGNDKLRWCAAIRRQTIVLARDKLHGVPEVVQHARAFTILDPRLRAAQHSLISYAYTANADNGVSPKTLGAITYRACMTEDSP